MKSDAERAIYWEGIAKERSDEADYYQRQLVDAHTLIGRLVHQLSERWDTANLTKFFPTDNPHSLRTVGNAKGAKR
jgi:hypothetical protein